MCIEVVRGVLVRVNTSVGLVLSLFDTIFVSMRIPHFMKPAGYVYLRIFLFSIPFGPIDQSRIRRRQNRPSINTA